MRIKSLICAVVVSSMTVFATENATLDGQTGIIAEMGWRSSKRIDLLHPQECFT